MPKDWNIKMPNLKALSIHELWCLAELFDSLRVTTMNFCNQPRHQDTPTGDFMDDLWGEHFAGICQDLYEEVKQREPANHNEAEWQAWAIVTYLSKTDDFRGIMDAAVDALEARRQLVA
jgi:hypothetical protein